VYSWYLTLQDYIKPEEDAKKALRVQKEFEALERAKHMTIESSPDRADSPKA
jgi:hypothetical protein